MDGDASRKHAKHGLKIAVNMENTKSEPPSTSPAMASSAGAAVRTEEGGPDGTGVTETSVTAMLQKALEPTVLKVTDDSDGCGAKFR